MKSRKPLQSVTGKPGAIGDSEVGSFLGSTVMQVPVSPLPGALSELICQVGLHGSITLADRYGLLALLMDESLSEEDRQAVDRLLYSIRRHQVKVVDDLSALS